MVKKHLLKVGEEVQVEGNNSTFIVTNVGGQITVQLDLGMIPISSIVDYNKNTGSYITLGNMLTIDGANAILERLGAKGKVVAPLETVLERVESLGSPFDEKHNYFISLHHSNGKVSSAVHWQTDGTYINFGTKFYTEEVAKKLCILIEETLEAENETTDETTDGSKME